MGSRRKQLVGQFLLESTLTSFVALLTAVALSELLIPGVNRFLGSPLRAHYLHDPAIAIVVIGVHTEDMEEYVSE